MADAKNTESNATDKIFRKTYQLFFQYVADVVGDRKARAMAEQSYQTILKYFRNLATFELGNGSEINVGKPDLTDKEILAFSVWMQQLLKELKNFMIGVGHIDAEAITKEIQEPLKELGFYDFFEQAEELNY